MVAELSLSVQTCGFPAEEAERISSWIRDFYGVLPLTPDDFPLLWEIMRHDKKNENDLINFTLLSGVGKFEINRNCNRELVVEALKRINLES
jgi:3-dehydroquinate synthase